jgi:hypothetical protein
VPGYKLVGFVVPMLVPEMRVFSMPPALRPGTNLITVTAADARTGLPLQGAIWFNGRRVADTGAPFEFAAVPSETGTRFCRYGTPHMAPPPPSPGEGPDPYVDPPDEEPVERFGCIDAWVTVDNYSDVRI